jgi:ABC-type proline/glycine betaine transport system ATPase subunit
MDSTKIMVLNRGELAEYDKPAALLERPETIFSSMVEATGPEQSAHLRRIANGEIGVVQSLQSLKEELSERDKSANEDSISEEVVRALKEKKKSPKSSAKSSKSSSKSAKSASKSSKSSSSSSSSESSSESS